MLRWRKQRIAVGRRGYGSCSKKSEWSKALVRTRWRTKARGRLLELTPTHVLLSLCLGAGAEIVEAQEVLRSQPTRQSNAVWRNVGFSENPKRMQLRQGRAHRFQSLHHFLLCPPLPSDL